MMAATETPALDRPERPGHAEHESGQATGSLRAPRGATTELLQLGFISQLFLSVADIDHALQLACRFSVLWSRHAFRYEREDHHVEVRAAEESQPDAHERDAIDAALTICRLVAQLSANTLVPRGVDAPAACNDALCSLLTCPIAICDRGVRIRFSADDLRRKSIHADPILATLLLTHAERRLDERTHAQSVRARARRVLEAVVEGPAPRVETLARQLGLGVRTLHRRLRAEGTSFRALLAEQMLERSVHCLSSGTVSAKEVAFAVGFADPASFHRAFKRWTGHTVSQYRATNPQDPHRKTR